jgi:hypothetical protein
MMAADILTLPHPAWPPKPTFEVWVEAFTTYNSCVLHACKTNLNG